MTGQITHSYVWVADLDRALAFYRDTLGFEVREDVATGEGRRWVTVGHPEQPGLRLALVAVGSLDEEAAGHVRALLAAGAVTGGGLLAADCRATHADLVAKGVTFTREPHEVPWGIEAVFRDDSGNLWGLVQPR